ncbi:NAD(P)-dependent oxidoreductase [Acinetobacter stercoris]|uniref:2-(Hydroxymethyl)glutarate dehydrogenase n=1 Tax=Acinetobacter stercoris TaxID=2126983 RepID=A0A2U3N315_9GAMM|nr:NAD(P)-dependent oxidoreductase [Acinetobacter stercoris]SPL72005.1 2-(hydroxymethyl)glutarate dehydrogenase [Acinetobacter stercoris]
MNTIHKPVIAVLGTGLMGQPIARNLHRYGYTVHVWNRTLAKAQDLQKEGLSIFETAAQAVKNADVILTVLKDGLAVEDTIRSASTRISKGTIWIQLSTVGLEATSHLKQFADKHGIIFYDIPMQGTRLPAEQAQLIFLASGPLEQRQRIEPILNVIGKKTFWISTEIGASSRLKLALNSWVFALTNGLAESLSLAQGLGIDPQLVVDVVSGSPMDNGYFQLKSKAILNQDYSANFSIKNAIKDAELIMDAAQQVHLQLDLVPAGLCRFQRAAQQGHADKDMAASYLAEKLKD